MSDPNWTPAMARQDISDQTEEANDAWNDEISSQRHADWVDIYDDRQPSAAEHDEQYWVYEQRAREWWDNE